MKIKFNKINKFIKFVLLILLSLFFLSFALYILLSTYNGNINPEFIEKYVKKFNKEYNVDLENIYIGGKKSFFEIRIKVEKISIKNKDNFNFRLSNVIAGFNLFDAITGKLPFYIEKIDSLDGEIDINYKIEDENLEKKDKNENNILILKKDIIATYIKNLPKNFEIILKRNSLISNVNLKIRNKKSTIPIKIKNISIIVNKKKSIKNIFNLEKHILFHYKLDSNNFSSDANVECILRKNFETKNCTLNLDIGNINNIKGNISKFDKKIKSIIKNIQFPDNLNFYTNISIKEDNSIDGHFKLKTDFKKIELNKRNFLNNNISISGKINKNAIISLDNIFLKMDNLIIKSDSGSINIDFEDGLVLHSDLSLKIDNFSNKYFDLWPENFLPNVKSSVSNLVKNLSNGKIKIIIDKIKNNLSWILKMNFKNAIIEMKNFSPVLDIENLEIEIDKDKTIILSKEISFENKKLKISDPKIEINYKSDLFIDILIKNGILNLKDLDKNLSSVNKSIYGFIEEINQQLLKNNEKNGQILLKESKIRAVFNKKGNFDLKNTTFDLNLNINCEDIFFINECNKTSNISLKSIKLNQSNIIKSNIKFSKLALNGIFFNDNTFNNYNLESLFKIEDNKNEITISLLKNGNKKANFNITSNNNNLNYNINLNNDGNLKIFGHCENKNDLYCKIDLDGENFNLSDILKYNGKKNNEDSKIYIPDLDINAKLKNSKLTNEFLADNFILQLKIKNANLKNILLDSSIHKNENNIVSYVKKSSKDEKYEIYFSNIGHFLNSLNLTDRLIDGKINGDLTMPSGGDIVEIKSFIEDIGISVPELNSNNTSKIVKIFIPMVNSKKNKIEFNKVDLKLKIFLSRNNIIMNIDQLIAKSDISKLTSTGTINFDSKDINLLGKLNTAYKINRVMTAEKIPILHNILTLGSKDGGIGTIGYSLNGNIKNLSSESFKVTGDRANLLGAGIVTIINPIIGISLALTGIESKPDNQKQTEIKH